MGVYVLANAPGYKVRGYITVEELSQYNLYPPGERLEKGPAVVIECPEEIPCNICVDACPFKAISMDKIYGLPRVDWNKCIGCGVCVPRCPGLAIFVIDLSKPDKAYVTVPYEFLPEPRKGDEAVLLSRDGREVGVGRVVRAWKHEGTWAVTVEVPRDKAMEVRAIWIRRK